MVLKIAHRGASGYEPENTLRSFRKAIRLGVDMVECDVHLTKDGYVVVIHDDKVERTTNGKGKVTGFTLKEIKKLNAGKGEKVPTLEEVIDLVKEKCKLNVEIKGEAIAEKVVKVIAEHGFVSGCLLSSDDVRDLQVIKKINPGIRTGLVFPKGRGKTTTLISILFYRLFPFLAKRVILNRLKKANTNLVGINIYLASKGTIKFLLKKNLVVAVWKVNSREKIEKLKEWGVNGIFSDFPDRI